MKRLLALAALGAALTVAACEQPRQEDEGLDPMPPMDAAPPPVEPEPVPVETPPTTTAPTDPTALPDDKRSSEETVRPESETLFY